MCIFPCIYFGLFTPTPNFRHKINAWKDFKIKPLCTNSRFIKNTEQNTEQLLQVSRLFFFEREDEENFAIKYSAE